MAPPVLATRDNLTRPPFAPLASSHARWLPFNWETLVFSTLLLWHCNDTDIDGPTINPGRQSCKVTKRRIFNWVSVELSFKRGESSNHPKLGILNAQEILLEKSRSMLFPFLSLSLSFCYCWVQCYFHFQVFCTLPVIVESGVIFIEKSFPLFPSPVFPLSSLARSCFSVNTSWQLLLCNL